MHCSYGTRNDMHLIDMAKTKPKIKPQSIKEIFVTSSPNATNMCRTSALANKGKYKLWASLKDAGQGRKWRPGGDWEEEGVLIGQGVAS